MPYNPVYPAIKEGIFRSPTSPAPSSTTCVWIKGHRNAPNVSVGLSALELHVAKATQSRFTALQYFTVQVPLAYKIQYTDTLTALSSGVETVENIPKKSFS